MAEAYNADPLADDSADEKKIRKAKKEGKYYGIKSSKMLECLEQETESHTENGMKLRKEKLSYSLLAISRAHSLQKKKEKEKSVLLYVPSWIKPCTGLQLIV